jgi:hypothetical protein
MPPPTRADFSFLTLLALLSVLGISCLTFWLLVRRATSHRQWVALSDWGRSRGFRYHPIAETELPQPFDALPQPRPAARLWLAGKTSQLIQMQAQGGVATATWHVLILQLETDWPPTALRPASAEQSMLDAFSLGSFPSMISAERFVIFGADSAAAKSLAESTLPALLPPDVGLLLHGRRLVLDFSDRPFDTIEFDRILNLANQLAGRLPSL